MNKKQFEKTEISIYEISERDVITTSSDITPWDPVSYSRKKPSADFGNDAGIQGGAN